MPMDRQRYPENWDALSHRIKEAANWSCQNCGKPCLRPGESVEELSNRLSLKWQKLFYEVIEDEMIAIPQKSRFILTTAHLDQNPANNAPENLRALCAPCHLEHDRPFLAHNRYRKRERRGQLSLF